MSEELKPTPEYLRSVLSYHPITGVLAWKITRKRCRAGEEAGSPDSKGRMRMEINGRSYSVASVCWAIYRGQWPKHQLDHKNRVRTDNRIVNLREATNQQNSFNRQKHAGKQLAKGVSLHRGRYTSRITVSGKTKNLGSFGSEELAAAAYRTAAAELHGGFAAYE